MVKFPGKVALVTGGSRGIGKACAIELARQGADIAVNYRSSQVEAESTVQEIQSLGRISRAYKADTSNFSQVTLMIESVVNDFGGIDILVNNAGVLKRSRFLEISQDEWDWVLNTNLKGYFLVGQAVARVMTSRGGGVIVNVSSNTEELPAPNLAHYSVAKAGVGMLTKSMALELAPSKIRVVAVAPGLIETDMNRKDIADSSFRERRLARIPLKIIGKPEDVAKMVAFVASDDARLATGHTIFIDAGSNIT
jgi:NAD(P)-dependent dehydrogenase (short-subunit alcohol dehydrogenase family)